MLRIALTSALGLGVTLFSASPQSSAPASLPHVRLVFPPGIPSETIQVEYFLSGSFGGYGRILATEHDQGFIDIAASVDGKPAEKIKIIAYMPGCEFVAVDLPAAATDITDALICHPLGTQRLHGRILPNPALADAPGEITVDYDPMWSMRFFGIADGMTMIVHLGKVPVRNGEFTVDLPDFARQANLGDGYFLFSMGEGTAGTVATLNPVVDGKPSYGLEARSSYEGAVEFVAERR